jgi:YVTN family beta-propeller protein
MTKIKNSAWLFSALAITLFSSCKKDENKQEEKENFKGVIVLNEGGFGKSNASVGMYKPGTGDYFDAFKKANVRPIGDVIQSMTLIGDKYYIVVNNSNKIEVVNKSDFKSVTTIAVNQPRFIMQVSPTRAYISQMNGSTMSVLDLSNNTISKTINVKASTENMVMFNGRVYVGEAFGDMVYVINDTTDAVVDSIEVGTGVGSIAKISDSKIAVFCTGIPSVENAKIAFINKDSMKLEKVVPLTAGTYMGSMVYHSGKLFYNSGDSKIFSIAPADNAAASTPNITLASGSVYAFTIDPTTGELYVTDAGDFNTPGKVYIYKSSFALNKQFVAGIVPGRVLFNN